MGFYGASSETNISQLGLIVQDSVCTAKAHTDMELQRRAQELIAADNSALVEKFSSYVVLGWAALILLTILVFAAMANWNRLSCRNKGRPGEGRQKLGLK